MKAWRRRLVKTIWTWHGRREVAAGEPVTDERLGGLASSAQKVKCKDQNLFQSIQFVSLAPSSSEDDSWINKWPGSIGAPG